MPAPTLTLPALTLRDRRDDDLPTLWRWLHAESDPEWKRWDAPYFHEEAPAGGGWWELGVLIFDPRHWGGGLGTQALRLWTDATFAQTGAHVLTLTTWGGNERIIRAAARTGFHECARIPQARAWAGQRWDSVKLAQLRTGWAGDQAP